MCTEQYAKLVANKTNGLVNITLFSLILDIVFVTNVYILEFLGSW